MDASSSRENEEWAGEDGTLDEVLTFLSRVVQVFGNTELKKGLTYVLRGGRFKDPDLRRDATDGAAAGTEIGVVS